VYNVGVILTNIWRNPVRIYMYTLKISQFTMRRDLTVTVKRSLSKNCFCKKADKNFFAFNTNDILTGYKLIKSTGWADHIVDHPTSHGSVVLSIMTSVCPASNGEQTIASIV